MIKWPKQKQKKTRQKQQQQQTTPQETYLTRTNTIITQQTNNEYEIRNLTTVQYCNVCILFLLRFEIKQINISFTTQTTDSS